MKKLSPANISKFVVTALAALALAAASSLASAQATRTWVSGVGDDVNPCSRTAPCKTFAGAISKTAALGEINVLDPGGFGAVTITKSLTIDGGGFLSGVLVNVGSGIIVNAAATDKVILRNIQFDGLGAASIGINVLSAQQVVIDNVMIFGFTTAAISVAPLANPAIVFVERARIFDNGIGISANAANAAVTVRLSDSSIQQNTTGLAPAAGASITSFNNNRLNGNVTDGAPTQTIYLR
jgi:hypothetical protein